MNELLEKNNQFFDVPKIMAFLFVVVVALHLSGPLWLSYFKANLTNGFAIARVDKTNDSRIITWDDFAYIPRINAVANGEIFSDPWNSSNTNWRGWGAFGLVPAVLGGAFKYMAGGNHFLALSIWSVVNFIVMSTLVYLTFRRGIFAFSRVISSKRMNKFLAWFFPIEAQISMLPFGTSVSVVARKK